MVWPATWGGSGAGSPAGEDKWDGGAESLGVSGAGLPPVRRGVDHGVTAGSGVVTVGESLDPSDHGAGTEPVALGLTGGALQVNHTGEGDSIAGPATAIGKEVVALSSSGGVWVGKVVTTTDEVVAGGTGVLRVEGGRLVGGSLSGLNDYILVLFISPSKEVQTNLDHDESGTTSVGSAEVDIWLVGRDIKTLDLSNKSIGLGWGGGSDGSTSDSSDGEKRELHCDNLFG